MEEDGIILDGDEITATTTPSKRIKQKIYGKVLKKLLELGKKYQVKGDDGNNTKFIDIGEPVEIEAIPEAKGAEIEVVKTNKLEASIDKTNVYEGRSLSKNKTVNAE